MSCGKKHKYANADRVTDHLAPKRMADGGKVKKTPLKPHVPPKVEDPIKPKGPPGGPHTPGAKGTYPMPGEKKKGK